ncbi:MAG TPA: hypothetical protein VJN93_16015 [Candidatus Acidoferrum sp.]|nr:hypothetical protein [Candidatus Acidoferrum sp.]
MSRQNNPNLRLEGDTGESCDSLEVPPSHNSCRVAGEEPVGQGQTANHEHAWLSSSSSNFQEGSNHPSTLSEAVIQKAITGSLAYLRAERERFWQQGRHLNDNSKASLGRYFSRELLEKARAVALIGCRLANPPAFSQARSLGIANLPDLAHQSSVSFLDVVVFNEPMTDRQVFHSLVHVAQVHVLGARLFTELFVRGVVRMRSYPLAPMKAQAFELDTRFASKPDSGFSVEAEIREWFNHGRY